MLTFESSLRVKLSFEAKDEGAGVQNLAIKGGAESVRKFCEKIPSLWYSLQPQRWLPLGRAAEKEIVQR